MDNKIGHIISELRNKEGLTQKELAEALHVSDKTISHWEKGDHLPQIDMLNHISKFFKIPLSDLITVRVAHDSDENLVHDIISSFEKSDERKTKFIKIILSVAFILILTLIVTIIFTNSYNRFKVYNVTIESEDLYETRGIYVETKINDVMFLENIEIKDYKYNVDDIISVDIYYKDNDKKKVLTSFDSLSRLEFFTDDGFVKIDDLSNYINNLYISVIISNDKETKEYNGKIKFKLDFTNNENFAKESNYMKYKSVDLSVDEIKNVLIKNKYEYVTDNILMLSNKNYVVEYFNNSNKIIYSYENKHFKFRYIYYLKMNILHIEVVDNNNIEIENYKYDVSNDKVIECEVGNCNNYKEAYDTLYKDVLHLLYK